MEIKTDVRVSLDLHFTSDDLGNRSELARLAAVCDGLQLLLRSQSVSQETLVEDDDAGPVLPAITAMESTPSTAQTEDTAEESAAVEPPPSRRQMPASRSWSFEEFDAAVRAEIKRLGRNGELPTGTIWNRERSEELPTLTGVMRRYGCKNMAEFEEKLQAAPIANNGAAGRHL